MTTPIYSKRYLRYALGLLFVVNVINYADRMVLSVLIEPIKAELHLSDTQLGLLNGFAFAMFYATAGIAIAWLADRYSRKLIMAISMVAWTVMTALTGTVQNFWHLLVTRIGVGVGEAGCIPTAHSLISDHYSAEKRSAALSVFAAGTAVGVAAGLSLGGWISEQYGWRWAFLAAAIPGLPFAFLVWMTLREPPRGLSDEFIHEPGEISFLDTLRNLLTKSTYIHIVIAASLKGFIVFGILGWMPAFLMRRFDIGTAELGLYFGPSMGLSAAIGSIAGGLFSNYMAKRDIRWLLRLPLIASFFYLPVYEAAFFAPSFPMAIFLVMIVNIIGGTTFGPMIAAMQSVLSPAMRATGSAFHGFMISIIGTGSAPLLIGLLSDLLRARMGNAGALQAALALSVLASIWMIFHLVLALRRFERDLYGSSATVTVSSSGQYDVKPS